MTEMPPLETTRLLIRPFKLDDLDAAHTIFDIELSDADMGGAGALTLGQRSVWLQWAALNHGQLAALYQPPYGDRALVLKESGRLIGAIGYVPCLMPFAQLPYFAAEAGDTADTLCSAELGLYWAVSPAHQRRGYTSEAAAAVVDYAFKQLRLRRIVATTTYDNLASMGVMRKLGMRIEQNPRPDPPWLQVVGVLENRA